ncbi:MAG: peptidoglycan DD-metalloendopeptidase family protein [Paludibacter sp.]|jgi:LysM repeat protein|nr:peptidoglycan DD-metalloendopeptidase family protein [Paludibacter sp.]
MKLRAIIIAIILANCINANSQIIQKHAEPYIDTINYYHKLFNDATDDLMENHPADDLYKNIWTNDRINPYSTPIDSLNDSIHIDCSDFHLPTKGYITSKFGPRRYRYHFGTDIKLYVGDSVQAAFSGEVRIIDYEQRGYGHYIVVRHRNGLETVYAHLSKVLVEIGQTVKSGEIIALGGNTGRSSGSHLHFETRYLGNAIDPSTIINFELGSIRDSIYVITKGKSFYYQSAVATQKATKYVTVRSGDNLGKLAARNGTSIRSICRLNGIKETKVLKVGERIRIR